MKIENLRRETFELIEKPRLESWPSFSATIISHRHAPMHVPHRDSYSSSATMNAMCGIDQDRGPLAR